MSNVTILEGASLEELIPADLRSPSVFWLRADDGKHWKRCGVTPGALLCVDRAAPRKAGALVVAALPDGLTVARLHEAPWCLKFAKRPPLMLEGDPEQLAIESDPIWGVIVASISQIG